MIVEVFQRLSSTLHRPILEIDYRQRRAVSEKKDEKVTRESNFEENFKMETRLTEFVLRASSIVLKKSKIRGHKTRIFQFYLPRCVVRKKSRIQPRSRSSFLVRIGPTDL